MYRQYQTTVMNRPNKYYRHRLAENSSDPLELGSLAGDKVEGVRKEVAQNPSTLASALEKLVGDENKQVRRYVARNPNTSVLLLEKLSGDKDQFVRDEVAKNPNTPVPILEKLADDVDKRAGVSPETPTHRFHYWRNWRVIRMGMYVMQ